MCAKFERLLCCDWEALEAEVACGIARRLATPAFSRSLFLPLPDGLGAEVARTDGYDLNGSVQSAVDGLGPEVTVAVVVHADLADPLRLAATLHDAEVLVRQGYVVMVPDLDDDGTNLLGVPTRAGFRFSYGVGSAARHRDEAARLGIKVHSVVDSPLAWDVDNPGDLP